MCSNSLILFASIRDQSRRLTHTWLILYHSFISAASEMNSSVSGNEGCHVGHADFEVICGYKNGEIENSRLEV